MPEALRGRGLGEKTFPAVIGRKAALRRCSGGSLSKITLCGALAEAGAGAGIGLGLFVRLRGFRRGAGFRNWRAGAAPSFSGRRVFGTPPEKLSVKKACFDPGDRSRVRGARESADRGPRSISRWERLAGTFSPANRKPREKAPDGPGAAPLDAARNPFCGFGPASAALGEGK